MHSNAHAVAGPAHHQPACHHAQCRVLWSRSAIAGIRFAPLPHHLRCRYLGAIMTVTAVSLSGCQRQPFRGRHTRTHRATPACAPAAVWRGCSVAVGAGWPPPLCLQQQHTLVPPPPAAASQPRCACRHPRHAARHNSVNFTTLTTSPPRCHSPLWRQHTVVRAGQDMIPLPLERRRPGAGHHHCFFAGPPPLPPTHTPAPAHNNAATPHASHACPHRPCTYGCCAAWKLARATVVFSRAVGRQPGGSARQQLLRTHQASAFCL